MTEVVVVAAARAFLSEERARPAWGRRAILDLNQAQAQELLSRIERLADKLSQPLRLALPESSALGSRPEVEMLVTWLVVNVDWDELEAGEISPSLGERLSKRGAVVRAQTVGAELMGALDELAETGILERGSGVTVAMSSAISAFAGGPVDMAMGDYMALLDWGAKEGGAMFIPGESALEVSSPECLRLLDGAGLLTWTGRDVVLIDRVTPGRRLWAYTTNPPETLRELRAESP